ncbi:MAG: asparagine synthase (glutamine-hydrolyzing) [Acidobacteriota bacterium]
MCGIYGMLSLMGAPLRHPDLAAAMAAALRHRGPDGHGELQKPHIIIGTERLRIMDPHPRGDQPFSSPERGLWLACNGEIYNAVEIRNRYPHYPFRSHSDVETLVPLFMDHGDGSIDEIDGMFAIAIWDEQNRSLLLARDRAGEKPLFYTITDHELWFASEPSALLVNPDVSREVDAEAVHEYLALGYALEPRTLHRSIRRVESGTIMRVEGGRTRVHRYWNPTVSHGLKSTRGLVDKLATTLECAVNKQLESDVPLGVFASGGLDSSLIAALAVKKMGKENVSLFSVGFPQRSFSETDYAERVAAALGARHSVVVADARSLAAALETIVANIAEPIADPAVLPSYLLSCLAARDVKVVMSGEGADELFGGYPTYIGHRLAGWYQAMPGPLRRAVQRRITHAEVSGDRMPLEYLLKRFVGSAGEKMAQRHLSWFGTGFHPAGSGADPFLAALDQAVSGSRDPLNELMLFDYQSYLRDNLLVKVDRATMLASIEARAPYLDRDLTSLTLSIPSRYKLRRFESKWILKKVAERHLPREFVYRRKQGLSVPVAGWINDTLRDEVDRVLDPARLKRQDLFPVRELRTLLDEHRRGTANHIRALWPMIILQLWMERWT